MITAKKSLGQNFLKDQNVINNIVNSAQISPEDLVIEIGPGQGALTKIISQIGCKFIAFEIDERMHEKLDCLVNNNVSIIYKDILSVDLKDELKNYSYKKIKVIANLPYYITSPIIEKLILSDLNIDEIIVMVQKEVADRFSATNGTKEYGFMTVFLNLYYNVTKLFNVKNTCFDPIPNVDSAVIKMTRKNNRIFNITDIKKFLTLAFSHKRKTLKNNLPKELWEQVLPILKSKGYSDSVRAEEISVDDYIYICNQIHI